MENDDTKLNVSLNGKDITIDVIDIIEAQEFGKEFIVYTIDGLDESEIFASILNEKEDSYSLDTIESEEELNYVNNAIKSLVNSTEVTGDESAQ